MSAETASIPSPPPRPRPSATTRLLGPGVSFPAAPNGTRSTTAPAKSVWAAAALALGTPRAPPPPPRSSTSPTGATRTTNTSRASPSSNPPPRRTRASDRAARASTPSTTRSNIRGDDVATLREALSRPDDGPALATAVVRGAGPKPEPALVPVPFRDPNPADPTSTRHAFEGADGDARASLGQRRRGGTRRALALDAVHANAARWTAADLEDIVFVLLGGTSELCPAKPSPRGASVGVAARGSARLPRRRVRGGVPGRRPLPSPRARERRERRRQRRRRRFTARRFDPLGRVGVSRGQPSRRRRDSNVGRVARARETARDWFVRVPRR